MDRLLLSCPSRGRPQKIKEMLDSYYKTKSAGTDLVIYLDDDDPKLAEYDLHGSKIWVLPRMHVAQIHNWIAKQYPEYDYYMPINDDVIFRTKGWDKILIDEIKVKGDGWGISYGNDLCGNISHELPTFGMLSANIVNTLGYVYPKELLALFGDTYLLDLGRAIGKIFYCASVTIEHQRPASNADDVRISDEFNKRERAAYASYIDKNLDRDVAKIFDAICTGSLR